LRKRTLRRSGEQTFALQSGNLAHFREDFYYGYPPEIGCAEPFYPDNVATMSCQTLSVRYNERMKTLTITEGRGRLGYWLKKATQGEDIGFVIDGKIVALRPVEVVSADYALQEYGLRPEEMAAAEKRIIAELKTARARGELTPFTGSKDDFH
jgi:hypothetical protein